MSQRFILYDLYLIPVLWFLLERTAFYNVSPYILFDPFAGQGICRVYVYCYNQFGRYSHCLVVPFNRRVVTRAPISSFCGAQMCHVYVYTGS